MIGVTATFIPPFGKIPRIINKQFHLFTPTFRTQGKQNAFFVHYNKNTHHLSRHNDNFKSAIIPLSFTNVCYFRISKPKRPYLSRQENYTARFHFLSQPSSAERRSFSSTMLLYIVQYASEYRTALNTIHIFYQHIPFTV